MRLRKAPTRVTPVTGLEAGDPVPEGYPFELSDEKLDAVLRDMLAAIPGFDDYRRILPELKLSLILIGAQERSRRNSDRLGSRSLLVAVLAVAVALVSLIVSIILAA